MNEKEFFHQYIPALEQALLNDNVNHGFSVSGPDWYIDDANKRKEVDLFEQKNFESFEYFFENVALYFDAKSHGFDKINGVKIEICKGNLKDEILKYKKCME